MKHAFALCLALTFFVAVTPRAGHAQAAAAPADGTPKSGQITPGAVGDFPAFADVPKNHWAYQSVQTLHRMGILRGEPASPRAVNTKARAKRGDVKKAKA